MARARARVDGLTISYDVRGDREPLVLIPYLSADHACYAFQLPAYIEHFSCIAGVSLRAGVGMHLAVRHPGRVRSLSLHSASDTSDLYLNTVVELWRTLASSLPTAADVRQRP